MGGYNSKCKCFQQEFKEAFQEKDFDKVKQYAERFNFETKDYEGLFKYAIKEEEYEIAQQLHSEFKVGNPAESSNKFSVKDLSPEELIQKLTPEVLTIRRFRKKCFRRQPFGVIEKIVSLVDEIWFTDLLAVCENRLVDRKAALDLLLTKYNGSDVDIDKLLERNGGNEAKDYLMISPKLKLMTDHLYDVLRISIQTGYQEAFAMFFPGFSKLIDIERSRLLVLAIDHGETFFIEKILSHPGPLISPYEIAQALESMRTYSPYNYQRFSERLISRTFRHYLDDTEKREAEEWFDGILETESVDKEATVPAETFLPFYNDLYSWEEVYFVYFYSQCYIDRKPLGFFGIFEKIVQAKAPILFQLVHQIFQQRHPSPKNNQILIEKYPEYTSFLIEQ